MNAEYTKQLEEQLKKERTKNSILKRELLDTKQLQEDQRRMYERLLGEVAEAYKHSVETMKVFSELWIKSLKGEKI